MASFVLHVPGGFWLHSPADAVASSEDHQSALPSLPAVQRHALQVSTSAVDQQLRRMWKGVNRAVLRSDAPVSELSLELLLLQVVLPALLEQGHTRQWLKKLVHAWTFTAAHVL